MVVVVIGTVVMQPGHRGMYVPHVEYELLHLQNEEGHPQDHIRQLVDSAGSGFYDQ